MTCSAAEIERALVRRTRLRVSSLVAVVITVLVVAVGAVGYTVMAHTQDSQIASELRSSAENGAPATPPGCTWLVALDNGVVEPGVVPAPPGFPLRADLDAVAASGVPVDRTIDANGTEYRVRTQPGAGDRTVQAIFDARYQIADRNHLMLAVLIAELGGLLAAALTGLLVGRHAVAPLAEALDKQRRFVTDASHELRTPITQAYTRLQLLMRRAATADLPADHRDGLDRVAASIRGLGEVVEDMLLSARLAADPTPRRDMLVDLAELATTAVARERDRADEKRITLSVERPPGPLTVLGVETALRRAVGELLANAVRHTPEDGRIDLRLARSAGQISLTVADTGDGFDPVEADRLFERFHRGPSASERRFGLGLALLREVVTSHNGTIEAVGHPGRGARFTMRLPEVLPATTPESRADAAAH